MSKKQLAAAVVFVMWFSTQGYSATLWLYTEGKQTATVETSDVEVISGGKGGEKIIAEGALPLSEPGQPDIPWHTCTVLLPPSADIKSVTVHIDHPLYQLIEGIWNVEPSAPNATWDKDGNPVFIWPEGAVIDDTGRDISIYSLKTFWPGEVKVISKGCMHQWQLVEVAVPLVQYHPQTGQVQELVSADVLINFTRKGAASFSRSTSKAKPPRWERDRQRIQKIASNFDAAAGEYEGSPVSSFSTTGAEDGFVAAGVNSTSYVIITRNHIVSNSTKLAQFVTHKQSKGWTVLVKTEDDWGGGTGATASANIRNWLKSNYVSQDILYVLLIGNPDTSSGDVPMQWYDDGRDGGAPTDVWYGDLDDDSYDQYWEVVVGRIPYYGSYSDTDAILQKTMDYENAANTLWRRNVLLPMVPLDDSTPSFQCGEQLKYDCLESRAIRSTRIYDDTYNLYPQPEYIRSQKYPATAWREGQFGIVAWLTHGWDEGASGVMNTGDLGNFTNNYPSAVYEGSCQNAWPENSGNLAYSILKKGGITTVAATRNSFYNVSQTDFTTGGSIGGLCYCYTKNMAAGQSCGLAIANAKQEVYFYPPNRTRMVLYGDPSIKVYPAEPALAVSPTETFSVNKAAGRTFTQRELTLSNRGTTSLNWTASSSVGWLSLSAAGGSLNAGSSANLTVSTNSGADALGQGTHTGTITITDTTNSVVSTRQITLVLSSPRKLAHWKLDEGTGTTISDSSGSGRTGTLLNMDQTNWVSGIDFTALQFNGSDEYSRINSDLNVNSDSLTITGWIKRDGTQSSFAGLFMNRYYDNVNGLNFGSGNELRYHWNSASNTYGWNSGLVPPNNTWIFVALVIEPHRATMYMHNGSSLQSAVNNVAHLPAAWEGSSSVDALVIGSDPLGGRLFKGALDDFRVYNYAATQAEILAIRSDGTGDLTAPTPNPMTWAAVPYESGTGAVTMTASAASDPAGVEYYFDCVSGGGHDSGWQSSTTYTDNNLWTLTAQYRVKARDKSPHYNETTLSVPAEVTITRHPYGTQTHTIPSKIQVEEFDVAGQGLSYHDTTTGNSGGALRPNEDVDIISFTESSVTYYAVDSIETGEWLEYTVNSTAGPSDVSARIASTQAGGQIKIWLDTTLLATIPVHNTGSLTTWQIASATGLTLPEQTSAVLRLEFVGTGFRVDWITFQQQGPYGAGPSPIPGKIEFEDYDIGGSGIAWYDTTPAGNGYGNYRSDGVDIYLNSGILSVFTVATEWLEYTVDIVPGVYDIKVRSASTQNKQTLALTLDDQSLTVFNLPNTGSWTVWQETALPNISITAGGQHVLRMIVGPMGVNLDYMTFVRHYNPADIDKSTRVDMGDFMILSSQWQAAPGQPSADIAVPYNNLVDTSDLTVMAENWLIEN